MANVDTNLILLKKNNKNVFYQKVHWKWYNWNAWFFFIDNIFVVWWTCL